MPKLRIGCVPYLNARPLIRYFETPEGSAEAEVVLAPPSALGPMVMRGDLDVALASSYFAIQQPDLRFVPGVSISSRGPVESVRLFSRAAPSDITTVALDPESMTSNQLVRILLAEKYGVFPTYKIFGGDIEAVLSSFDAVVRIGDAGLYAEDEGLQSIDLGAAWQDLTGLPFVWAMWLCRTEANREWSALLQRAKAYGIERITEIAMEEGERRGVGTNRCLHYLAEVMDYDLTETHLLGFERYRQLCEKHDVCPIGAQSAH